MRLDVARQELIDGSARVHLTPGEFLLMERLASGKSASIDNLIFAIWASEGPESASKIIPLMVWRIRKKLTATGIALFIGNIWGKGYVLSHPVDVVRQHEEPITIPAEHRATLERLLFSHPDQAAADRVLASFVGG